MEKVNEFTNFAEEVSKIRNEFAQYLDDTAKLIKDSGLPGLERYIGQLSSQAGVLRQEVFRVLVMGDFNRGKSTLLNALIGKALLPTKIVPCTAILTKIRYGKKTQITVYFKDNRKPTIFSDFLEYGKVYSIPKTKRTSSENEEVPSFPEVDHAVIEYDNNLLANGVEFIDSPGLNRSQGDNDLTLSYIQNCQAVLFVLDAQGQMLSMNDKFYLKHYLYSYFVGLGINLPKVFFVLNQWDLIAERCMLPTDLPREEENVRSFFEEELANQLNIAVSQVKRFWGKRMFQTSALREMRNITTSGNNPEETGIAKLRHALGAFLKDERLKAEIESSFAKIIVASEQAKSKMDIVCANLREGKESVQKKVRLAKTEVEKLKTIISDIKRLVEGKQRSASTQLADSFNTYLNNVATTFENDFREPAFQGVWGTKTNMERYRDDVAHECERLLVSKVRSWQQEATTALEEHMNVLNRDVNDRVKNYKEQRAKINGILLTNSESSGTSSSEPTFTSTINYTDFRVSGDKLGASTSFALSTVVGTMAGIAVGAAIAKITAGLVLGPVGAVVMGVAAILTAYNANKTQKESLRKEILEKTKQNIRAEAFEGRKKILSSVKTIFDPFFPLIDNLNNDLDSLNKGIDSLENQKKLTEEDTNKQETSLKIFLQSLQEQNTKVRVAFEKIFGINITNSYIENILRQEMTSASSSFNPKEQVINSKSSTSNSQAQTNSKSEKKGFWNKIKNFF